jgi:hypothetical protein
MPIHFLLAKLNLKGGEKKSRAEIDFIVSLPRTQYSVSVVGWIAYPSLGCLTRPNK